MMANILFFGPLASAEKVVHVGVEIYHDIKRATVTGYFRIWPDGNLDPDTYRHIDKSLAEMSDDEILDGLLVASRVGKSLEENGYVVEL